MPNRENSPTAYKVWGLKPSPFDQYIDLMRKPANTPRGKRYTKEAGCAVVAYHMFVQDMVRFGWSLDKELRANVLAIRAAELGGWSDVG